MQHLPNVDIIPTIHIRPIKMHIPYTIYQICQWGGRCILCRVWWTWWYGTWLTQFAKNKLHLYLSQNIKKLRAASNSAKIKRESSEAGGKPKSPNKETFHPRSWPDLSVASYEKCVRMAHLQSNRAMHDDKTVKDAMSGTTASCWSNDCFECGW